MVRMQTVQAVTTTGFVYSSSITGGIFVDGISCCYNGSDCRISMICEQVEYAVAT